MILVLDDEPGRLTPWTKTLKKAYPEEVEILRDPEQARERCKSGHVDLLIWDVMLPTPAEFDEADTDYGSRTGRVVYQALRYHAPQTPSIMFTNVLDEGLWDSLEPRPGLDRRHRKPHTTPAELVETVRELLGR